jgi:hypothetical protein
MQSLSTPAQSRELLELYCSLKFVQGFRCSHCKWAYLFPDCHVKWAIPFCYTCKATAEFEQHQCSEFGSTPEPEEMDRPARMIS